ncbi:MAG: hypothetical protein OHK0052_09410 [Anaerolineales bacterium]
MFSRLARLPSFWLIALLTASLLPQAAFAQPVQPVPQTAVRPADLILAMNTLRVAYGNPPLIEDPIVNAVAQITADTMAANQMSWHIGDVRGRIAAAGYGGGATVWATENFAVGSNMDLDVIMAAWADPDHMRPAVTPAYCHVGAGVATAANGQTYYVLQAAYISGRACGSYTPATGSTPGSSAPLPVSQIIIPVKIATPDADGNVYHIVQAGQSLWAIAIAYQLTIADLEFWNNINRATPLFVGQKLFIPGKNTAGYATPTPRGMVMLSTPDASGRIVHQVQAYQTLITIAAAYNISLDRLLALNGWQRDWALQIGQKLLIDPGNITPSPTLSPVQQLTPAADGRYYHTVQSGQTLSWIAARYQIPLASLMQWNGLNNTSIIHPDQKLLLLVTPPATATSTLAPPTATPSPHLTQTNTPSPTLHAPTPTPQQPVSEQNTRPLTLWLLTGTPLLGALVWWLLKRRNR